MAETYSGLFRQGFEQSDFYPDGGGGPWWVSYGEDFGTRIAPFASGTGRGVAIVVRIEVEGEVSPPGDYGFIRAYEHELVVSRLVSVEAASQEAFEAAARAASNN